MAEVVYPFKLPMVTSLPQASAYTNRMVVYDNKIYFSDGTNWIELGSSNINTYDLGKYGFMFGEG